MTAGKWCYHPWTGNPVDHDFNTKKWCVTVTLQNIKKKVPPVFEAHGLVQNWATPKLSGISSCSSLKWAFLGYPHFRTNLYLHISPLFMEKHLCLTHNLGKTHDPMHPLWFQTRPAVPKIPIQSPLGQFFSVKAPVSFWNLASSFSRKSFGDSESTDFWEVAIR